MNNVIEIMDEIIQKCLRDVLPDFRLEELAESEFAREDLVVVAGLSGEKICGSLGLQAPAGTMAATYPLPREEGSVSLADLYDWQVELANQVTGNIKRELLKLGVSLWLTVPVALRGISIQLQTSVDEEVRRYFFSGKAGVLSLWLDFQFPPDLEFAMSCEEPICEAGEMLIF